MAVQLVLRIIMLLVVLWLIKATSAQAAAAAASVAKPNCQERCGNVLIPYPFGIGASCYGDEDFMISCNRSSGIEKPFLAYTYNSSGITNTFNLEVLNISVETGTVRVKSPVMRSNCLPNWPDSTLPLDLWPSPFKFSDTANQLIATGCDNLAFIHYPGEATVIIGGCISFFCNDTLTDGSCYGINCCQTRLPFPLDFFNASLKSINSESDGKTCKSAFIADQKWFSNLKSRSEVDTMANVPAVLNWRISGNCTSFKWYRSAANRSASLCRTNAFCFDHGNQSLCSCNKGYRGNPYLPNGCQDIDECENKPCEKFCTNIQGSYRCYCPSGFISLGDYCFKYQTSNRARIAILGTCIGLGILLLLFVTWWSYKIMKRKKKTKLKEKYFKRNGGLLLQQQLSSGEEGNVEKTKLFTSKELEKATDSFNANRILGQGGQGTVYKGMLTDGRIVAVKKSKIEDEGKLEHFINEVVILSQINHRNVVKLHGCCLETEVPLLVYEFIPNGTLFEYIHYPNEEFPLSWDIRLRIATEIAGALSYLHSAASIPIYHRDIKSTNILLDDKYRAKVADFGTSRSIAVDQTHLTTRVQGTFGYLDPEYFQSSQFTEKSDVYSFGVVLAELLTGQKPISPSTKSGEGRSLATYFLLTIKENHLTNILDARVVKEGGKEEIMRVANLAKRCMNLNGRKRPTMKEVVMELEGIRMGTGAVTIQQQCEVVEYSQYELHEAWDTASTSTGSFVNNSLPSSLDVQPLLFK